MKEKDQIILEDSINVILSNVPGLNIAWGLSMALYEAGIKLRQKKVLEWVEMIRDNPDVFISDLLQNETFQDGFVYSLEKYIIERNKEKRKYFRNIFLGFSASDDKQNFPLEKFIHTLSQMNEIDIEVMRDLDINKEESYQIYKDKDKYRLDNISNLINLGILNNDTASRWGSSSAPYVMISEFGKKFIKYIENEK